MRSRDMVMQRRAYFGFGGIHTPSMPRTWRSGGKRTTRKKAGSSPMCAFDVLAAVAGEILLKETPMPFKRNGGEPKYSIITNPARNGHHHEAKPFKIEPSDQGSCNGSVVACYNHCQRFPKKFLSNDLPQALRSMVLEPSFDVKFETTRTTSCKPATYKSSGDILNSLAASSGKLCTEKHSPGSAESHVIKLEDGVTASQQTELQKGNAGTDEPSSDLLCKEDLADLDSKPPRIVSSDSSIELPSHRNFIPHSSSCPGHRDDMEIVDRDDDENSSKRTQPSNIALKAFIKHHTVDKKIRKICASKFWKVGPTLLQGGEPSKNGPKPLLGSRKICYPRPRTQHLFSKRRILSQRSPLSTCSGDIISEDVPLSPDENVRKEVCSFSATLHEGNKKPSSSAKDQKAQIKSEEYQVKFSIKSVKLPELFIEMPETATVAEMKRTVLDAMIAILQNKLRVGVLLQGKKVRDDSKTLVQSGLCDGAKLDSLGFSLEPCCSKAPQLITPEQLSLKGRSDEAEAELSPRLPVPAVPASESVVIDSKSDPASPSTATTVNHAESNLNLVPHTNDSLADKTTASSKALVAVPTRSAEALSVVPLHRKSKRAELAQRRIRRPFSVSEVEALVQAVEKLGTGRWRDVKLRAFDTAKHRTYVDLKDKWKTLVHTATISPQQRRGEPVPQPLLDRVLAAHAYWSQQQAKLQIKPQQLDQCIL